MNCSQVSLILNNADHRPLETGELEALDIHVADCSACRDEWQAQDSLLTLSIPRRSADLLDRIGEAVERVERTHAGFRRLRRPAVVGAVLLGAVTAAAAFVSLLNDPDDEQRVTVAAVDGSENAVVVESLPEPPVDGVSAPAINDPSAAPAAGTESADRTVAGTSDLYAVAVLPVRDTTGNAGLLAAANVLRDEFLRRFEEAEGLTVHDPDVVEMYARSGLSDIEIGRTLAAGTILVFSTDDSSSPPRITFTLYDPVTEENRGGGGWVYDPGRDSLPEELGEYGERMFSMAVESVRRRAYPETAPPYDPERAAADAVAVALDSTLADVVRARAIGTLRGIGGPERRQGAVAAAAVEIAQRSDDPEVRHSIWQQMTGAGDPYLIQPLLDALAFDPSEVVRREAAYALSEFAENSSVRQALETAEREDDSAFVREAAAVAKLTESGWLELKRQTFLDRSQPASERLRVFNPFNLSHLGPSLPIDNEVADALLEMAGSAAEISSRALAIGVLREASDPEHVAPLLDFLQSDPNETIRSSAASSLGAFADEPRVREALELAADHDPSLSVRGAARSVLERP